MEIGIIGWGSLIWNPAGLPHCGTWHEDGPSLPVEFSRISPDGRLTLIIDSEHGHEVVARWSRSPRSTLDHAVADLARREVCDAQGIGFVERGGAVHSRQRYPGQPNVQEIVASWCEERHLDAAVWTALPRRFEERTGSPFSVANALNYVGSLTGTTRARAVEYIRRAPELVDSPVRRAFGEDPRFS